MAKSLVSSEKGHMLGIADIKEKEVNKLLKEAKFIQAKSKDLPHSYTLRKDWVSSELFSEVVLFIRQKGVVERFWSKHYTYYYLDGYKYWSMGYPLNITKLINKAKV